jgi:hypothetical protein
MGAFCHTSVRQTIDFTAPECDARLKFSKKEMTIMKIVVGSFEGAGVPQKSEFPFPLHLRNPFIN